MKVIFLDIDGVLNSTGSILARTGTYWDLSGADTVVVNWTMELVGMIGGEFADGQVETFQTIDPTSVALINRLIARSGAQVVLSSSHRSMFVGSNYDSPFEFGSRDHLHALDLYLKLLGIEGTLHGITDRLWVRRGLEVSKYLSDNPEVTEHLAIDDAGGDFSPNDCHLHRTDPRYGFTGQDYFACARRLGVHETGIIV